MDRYAILKEGRPEFAPVNKGNISNYNLCPELMIADGYKLYEEGIKETGKLYHWSIRTMHGTALLHG